MITAKSEFDEVPMKDNVFENFRNNNESFGLYNELIQKLTILPKMTIKKRNSNLKPVIFCNRKNFACISLLDNDGTVLKTSFRIVFYPNKEIIDTRVGKIPEHLNDLVYYVTIDKESDIDEQLISWLKTSYDNAK